MEKSIKKLCYLALFCVIAIVLSYICPVSYTHLDVYKRQYNRRQITAVNMHKVNLDGQHLTSYPMLDDEEFYEQN